MEALKNRIEGALDSIRPYLQSDGGDVKLVKIREDMIVELKLMGACESCNMSNMTMKAGIEEAIRKVAPEILAVKSV